MRTLAVLGFLAVLAGPASLPAQEARSVVLVAPYAEEPAPTPTWLQQERLPPPGMKSPGLAAVLNIFIPYGTGNFYAGNEGHGVRHLVLGLGSVAGMVGGLAAACDEGFNFCDEESAGAYVAGGFALVWFTNWVWGIVSGIGDAKAHNRLIREAYSLQRRDDPAPAEDRDCDPLTQAERWEAYWNPEILEEWRRRCAEGG